MLLYPLVLIVFTILNCCNECKAASENIDLHQPEHSSKVYELAERRLNDLQNWINSKLNGPKDSFIGRCIGVARKLHFALPLILIKLTVIITILGFLSLFSWKSLGLLVLLIIFHTTKIAAKLGLGNHSLAFPRHVNLRIHKEEFEGDHGNDRNLWSKNGVDNFSDNFRNRDEDMYEKLKMVHVSKQLGINPYDTISLNKVNYSY